MVLACPWGGETVRGLEEELEEEDGGETAASGKESWRNSRKVKAIVRLCVVCDEHPSPAFSNVGFAHPCFWGSCRNSGMRGYAGVAVNVQAGRHVAEKPHIPVFGGRLRAQVTLDPHRCELHGPAHSESWVVPSPRRQSHQGAHRAVTSKHRGHHSGNVRVTLSSCVLPCTLPQAGND